MLKEKVTATADILGIDKIEAPIFYNCPVGIRFEIGVGSPYCYFTILSKKYVRAALQKAYTVYQNAPGTFDTLLWVIYPDKEKAEKKLLDRFCRITGLPLPQERHSVTLPPDDSRDEPVEEVRCYWDLQTHPAKIKKLFEEIIKSDIGGWRDLTSSIFLLNTNLNVMFYLYDDRGLDVAAASRDTIAQLYLKFGDWILAYDRERIDRTFEGGQPQLIDFSDYITITDSSIVAITEKGISYESVKGTTFISFSECAANYQTLHGGNGKCVGEIDKTGGNDSLAFYTAPLTTHIFFMEEGKTDDEIIKMIDKTSKMGYFFQLSDKFR